MGWQHAACAHARSARHPMPCHRQPSKYTLPPGRTGSALDSRSSKVVTLSMTSQLSTRLMPLAGCLPTLARPPQQASLLLLPPSTCWQPMGLGLLCYALPTRGRARLPVARGNRPLIAAFGRLSRRGCAPLANALATRCGLPASGRIALCRGASVRQRPPPMVEAMGTGAASHRPSPRLTRLHRPPPRGGTMTLIITAPCAWTPWLARGRPPTPSRAPRVVGGRATNTPTTPSAAAVTHTCNTAQTTSARYAALRGAFIWPPEGGTRTRRASAVLRPPLPPGGGALCQPVRAATIACGTAITTRLAGGRCLPSHTLRPSPSAWRGRDLDRQLSALPLWVL